MDFLGADEAAGGVETLEEVSAFSNSRPGGFAGDHTFVFEPSVALKKGKSKPAGHSIGEDQK